MKIRDGFVSNSSSSSFILNIQRDNIKSPDDLQEYFNESCKEEFSKKELNQLYSHMYNIIQNNDMSELFDISMHYNINDLKDFLTNHTLSDYYQNNVYIELESDNDLDNKLCDLIQYMK